MVPVELKSWALRHHVSEEAIAELAGILGTGGEPANAGGGSEGRVQSLIRLAAPAEGMRLWRNNVGVLTDERGVPVRYGLANDSKKLNERLKSADLIGWRRVEIRPEMVGQVIAQFTSIECKAEGWKYRGDKREQAQNRWAALVVTEGGFARFATGPDGLRHG